jgi:hypothetical protein
MTTLSSFIVIMLAISLSAERIVEILKGWMSDRWLFRSQADPVQEARRCSWIHCLSGVCGGITAAVSHIDLFRIIGSRWGDHAHGPMHTVYWISSCSMAGALSSGGSAFWNHALDILRASKVRQEQDAIDAVAANQQRNLLVSAHPSSFRLAMHPAAAAGLHPAAMPATQPSISPCLMSLDPSPGSSAIRAKPGTLRLKLLPNLATGAFAFVPANCSVTDASGSPVSFNPSPTVSSLAFPVAPGTYQLTLTHLFTPDATALLVEDCAAQTALANLNSANAVVRYQIVVA